MSWLTWPWRILWFICWFFKEVVRCNWAVIIDNLSPGQNSTTGIAQLPTRCNSEFEVMLLGTLITLTPGTLTVGSASDVSKEQPEHTLYVHGMYNEDADSLRADVRILEAHMLAAVRREGLTS
ncbi:Na+/H+ antiporter subunit E [Natronoglycomyces albus]|uniref:Na+/H+ antiporter subunit E n=1 Tax=Natronoglycomyces albus TaxID=2811108 RepID=A0A895XPN7_9ACTN|nr:Na+/H+ antiporter subunit E [Natronoglycomyces albus]QSB05702.1 Na+/H+ antiporter subunit E [Natronoglycomyces albus]